MPMPGLRPLNRTRMVLFCKHNCKHSKKCKTPPYRLKHECHRYKLQQVTRSNKRRPL